MLDFAREHFRKWYSAILRIAFIACTLGGAIVGYTVGRIHGDYALIGVALGLIIGVILGLFMVIIGGGLVAAFLNIDDNIQKIRDTLTKQSLYSQNTSGGNAASGGSSGAGGAAPAVFRPAGDAWVCKNCGDKNPVTASSCKGCGAYR
jgi:uncharacterized membrane protein YgcG